MRCSRGKRSVARKEIDASLAIHETGAAWRLLGNWHEGASDWPAAVAAYEKALELEPDHVKGLHRAGIAWLRVGDPVAAERVLARAAELAPEDRLVRKSLARARALQSPTS